MKRKQQKAILTQRDWVLVAGMFETIITDKVEVRIMAEAEGWAMVRRKRAAPIVCQSKDLQKI